MTYVGPNEGFRPAPYLCAKCGNACYYDCNTIVCGTCFNSIMKGENDDVSGRNLHPRNQNKRETSKGQRGKPLRDCKKHKGH